MGINKVVYGNDTLIDLTNDTVSSSTLLVGHTAHNGAGNPISGTAIQGHVIMNSSTLPMAGRSKLKFKGYNVEDDPQNDQTVIEPQFKEIATENEWNSMSQAEKDDPNTVYLLPWKDGSSSSGVTSFNGRSGSILPIAGDYNTDIVILSSVMHIGGQTQTTTQQALEALNNYSGHTMTPQPSSSLTDAQIVSAINAPVNGADEHVVSAYSVQRWSNGQTKRFIVDGSDVSEPIGSSGIGTWDDSSTPTETDWLYIADLVLDATDSDDIDVSIKFDPSSGEPITLGGYIIDTSTGKICIRFGNSIANPTSAKIAIDITYLRNEVN